MEWLSGVQQQFCQDEIGVVSIPCFVRLLDIASFVGKTERVLKAVGLVRLRWTLRSQGSSCSRRSYSRTLSDTYFESSRAQHVNTLPPLFAAPRPPTGPIR